MHQRLFPRTLRGRDQPFHAEGLEHIVHGVGLERSRRVSIIGGDEHHGRHVRGPDGPQDAEAVGRRHLHVQKHQGGRQFLDGAYRRRSVGRLADDLEVRKAVHDALQASALMRFVVHDKNGGRKGGCAHGGKMAGRIPP